MTQGRNHFAGYNLSYRDTEFFPQSGYEYGNGVELEVYPSDDTTDPDYTCEIWVAVKD